MTVQPRLEIGRRHGERCRGREGFCVALSRSRARESVDVLSQRAHRFAAAMCSGSRRPPGDGSLTDRNLTSGPRKSPSPSHNGYPAPKGRNKLARGNALGIASQEGLSPEGAGQSPRVSRCLAPSGLRRSFDKNLGLRPRLTCFAPLGLQRSRAYLFSLETAATCDAEIRASADSNRSIALSEGPGPYRVRATIAPTLRNAGVSSGNASATRSV
jgi:hypothetical protein